MGGVAFAGSGPLEREIPDRESVAVGFGVQSVFTRDGNDSLSNGAASARRGVPNLELSPAPVNVLPLGRNTALLTTPTRNRSLDAPITHGPKSQQAERDLPIADPLNKNT
jgi:hypothetical protein